MTFGAILHKGDKKYQENHWGFHSNLTTFRDLAEVNFPLGKTAFQKMKETSSENPMNTGVYEDFWGHFAERWQKVPRKPLRFPLKLMTFRDLREVDFSLGKSAFRDMKKRVPKIL